MTDQFLHRVKKILTSTFVLLLANSFTSTAFAKDYTFIVQPILDPKKTKQLYQPLTKYLSQHTGHTIKIVTEKNFLTYWYKMKKGKYDLVLDAAHFTDFRINHLNYSVLAKIPDTVSFSLITHSDNLVLDTEELVGKTLATLPAPSIGAANLTKMFNSPTRQPAIINMKSAEAAISAVQSKKYFAALVPTPLVRNKSDINVITTTDSIPHMAISASDRIDSELQSKIRNALINAKNIHSGQILLQKLGVSAFNQTSPETYKGFEKYLAGLIRPSRISKFR